MRVRGYPGRIARGLRQRYLTQVIGWHSVEMELIGTIEPDNGATADRNEWIALIEAHSCLSLGKPRQGINPFTKEPFIYKPAPDYAQITVDGTKVGAIHWAMDESRRLVLWSLPTARIQVIDIAQEVAATLGWRLLPSKHA